MPAILPSIVVLIICAFATTTVWVLALVRYLSEGADLWTFVWGGVGVLGIFMMYQAITAIRKVIGAI